jgi:hypothetical protein
MEEIDLGGEARGTYRLYPGGLLSGYRFAGGLLRSLEEYCHSEADFTLVAGDTACHLRAAKLEGAVVWGVDRATSQFLRDELAPALAVGVTVLAQSKTAWESDQGPLTEVRSFFFQVGEAGVLRSWQLSEGVLREVIDETGEDGEDANWVLLSD